MIQRKEPTLRELEEAHSALLTKAGQAPAGSPERETYLRHADRVLREINDLHERANPTPLT